jgi:hypothetical protein
MVMFGGVTVVNRVVRVTARPSAFTAFALMV